jgi:DNA-binding GntR family transcriptional regulator
MAGSAFPGPRASEAPPRTRTEILRLQLADDIVSGALEPGSPLDEQDLARRFGVSRTPVREAIRQLAASGLVQSRAHRGAVVAHPAPRELGDMFRAMAELEALCAGLCAENMTEPEQQGLQRIHARFGRRVAMNDQAGTIEANEAFHNAIYAGTHNSYLAEITAMTRLRVAPFRRAQFRALGRSPRSHEEHGRIVSAILRQDRAGAAEAMRQHIDIVRDVYRAYSGAQ